MPILKSAKEAIGQSERRRVVNDSRRRALKEQVKTIGKLILAKDKKAADKALPMAFKAIDKAAKAGVIKKNTADRKKSRLAKSIANIA